MTIRDLLENGIEIQGPLKIARFNMEKEDLETLYESLDPEHILLKDENEDFTETDIRYMYTVSLSNGVAMMVIEVL